MLLKKSVVVVGFVVIAVAFAIVTEAEETGGKVVNKRAANQPKSSKRSKNGTTTVRPDHSTTSATKSQDVTVNPVAPSTSSTAKPAAGSADASTTTTSHPETSSVKPENRRKIDSTPDDELITQLMKDQEDEKILIGKMHQSLKDWIGWLQAHDNRSLNRVRARLFHSKVNAIFDLHINNKMPQPRNSGYQKHYMPYNA